MVIPHPLTHPEPEETEQREPHRLFMHESSLKETCIKTARAAVVVLFWYLQWCLHHCHSHLQILRDAPSGPTPPTRRRTRQLKSSRELLGEIGSHYGSYNEDCLAPWGGWLGETHYPSISRLTKAYMKEVAIELRLEKEGDLNICIMERHTAKDFTQKHSVRKEIF